MNENEKELTQGVESTGLSAPKAEANTNTIQGQIDRIVTAKNSIKNTLVNDWGRTISEPAKIEDLASDLGSIKVTKDATLKAGAGALSLDGYYSNTNVIIEDTNYQEVNVIWNGEPGQGECYINPADGGSVIAEEGYLALSKVNVPALPSATAMEITKPTYDPQTTTWKVTATRNSNEWSSKYTDNEIICDLGKTTELKDLVFENPDYSPGSADQPRDSFVYVISKAGPGYNDKEAEKKSILYKGHLTFKMMDDGTGQSKPAFAVDFNSSTDQAYFKQNEKDSRGAFTDRLIIEDAAPQFKENNIKTGIEILGKTGTFTSEATLADFGGKKPSAITSGCILKGYAGFINGVQVNGEMESRGTVDETLDALTTSYTVKPGNYEGGTIDVKTVSKFIAWDNQTNEYETRHLYIGGISTVPGNAFTNSVNIPAVPATNLEVTHTDTHNATSAQMQEGKVAYAHGKKITGTAKERASVASSISSNKLLNAQSADDTKMTLFAGIYPNEHSVTADVEGVIAALQAI